jgi:hypothetical protein
MFAFFSGLFVVLGKPGLMVETSRADLHGDGNSWSETLAETFRKSLAPVAYEYGPH